MTAVLVKYTVGTLLSLTEWYSRWETVPNIRSHYFLIVHWICNRKKAEASVTDSKEINCSLPSIYFASSTQKLLYSAINKTTCNFCTHKLLQNWLLQSNQVFQEGTNQFVASMQELGSQRALSETFYSYWILKSLELFATTEDSL